jgi:RNA polymerase sigma-70 factor (ECF subfamily)
LTVKSDADDLLAILDAHGAELYALLTRLTLRSGVAEDLMQELFLRLQSADGFARAANRKAYVFRTAIHLAFDWRRARRPTQLLRMEPASPAEPALAHLIDVEEREQVLEALHYLSELGRQVVVLRYLQQHGYAQIAEQVDKTEHQVRGICYKALEQLREHFRPLDSEPEKKGSQT